MLLLSLGAFTVVALIGLIMACDVFRKKPTSPIFKVLHVVFVLIGALAAIVAAFSGDTRVWINIVIALVIIGLGALLFAKRSKGEHPKGVVIVHGGLAVTCYLLLAYFTLFNHA